MVPRSVVVAAFVFVMLPFSTLGVGAQGSGPSPLAPVYDALEPVCAELREKDPRKDATDEGPSAPPPSGWDEFRYHPECYRWRNEVQSDFYDEDAAPSYEECEKVAGRMNCVGVHQGACDVGLFLLGISAWCIGMILPDE